MLIFQVLQKSCVCVCYSTAADAKVGVHVTYLCPIGGPSALLTDSKTLAQTCRVAPSQSPSPFAYPFLSPARKIHTELSQRLCGISIGWKNVPLQHGRSNACRKEKHVNILDISKWTALCVGTGKYHAVCRALGKSPHGAVCTGNVVL